MSIRDLCFAGYRTYILLYASQLHDALINRALGDQPVHCDLTSLPEAMSTVHCLSIVGRIPIVIIEYDCISRRKVYP